MRLIVKANGRTVLDVPMEHVVLRQLGPYKPDPKAHWGVETTNGGMVLCDVLNFEWMLPDFQDEAAGD